jgi:hypothetical protein
VGSLLWYLASEDGSQSSITPEVVMRFELILFAKVKTPNRFFLPILSQKGLADCT